MSILRRTATLVLVGLVVLVILFGWNFFQNIENVRWRLWGELVFVCLVVWLAFSFFSAVVAHVAGRCLPRLGLSPMSHPEALAWAVVLLAGVPIAVFYRWQGIAVLLGFAVAAIIFLFVGSVRGHWPPMPLWFSFLLGTLALGAYAWCNQEGTTNKVPLASPTPVVEEADSVARAFRPLLYFDSSERLAPIDIDYSVISESFHGCTYGVGAEECNNPVEPTESLGEFDYVKLVGNELRPGEPSGGPSSAYYHHVVERGDNLLVDYWWYFAHNPAPVARNLLCGQGSRWLGEACAEHPADWEGLTIVLARCTMRPGPRCVETDAGFFRIEELRYAQHDKIVAYDGEDLSRRWARPAFRRWADEARGRPLVFVALHSHASYAGPCEARCPQIARPEFKERRNGLLPWGNNAEGECSECLKALPTDGKGAPTMWNAFQGRWGAQHCILFGSYCDVQKAPRAPSFQPRYRKLECAPASCIRSKRL